MTDLISSTNPTADSLMSDTPDVASAARELGLKPVRAWVPDEKKAGTAGAERTRRCREKAEQQGFKQLSVTLPTELHPMLKTLAARTKAGEPPEAVLAELLQGQPGLPGMAHAPIDAWQSCTTPLMLLLQSFSPLRRWLLMYLLPPALRNQLKD